MLLPLHQTLAPGGFPDDLPVVFDPLNVPGSTLLGWYQGDVGTFQDAALTTPAGPGDRVGGWQDQSGSGHHLTQSTSSRRGTVTGAALNGLNGVAFDGITQTLAATVSSAQPLTVYFVGRVDTNQSHSDTLYDLSSNGSTLMAVPPNMIAGNNHDGVVIRAGRWITGNWYQSSIVFSGTLSLSRLARVPITTFGSAGTVAMSRIVLAQRGDQSNANAATCTVAEMLVYAGTHTAGQILQVEAYLADKWGFSNVPSLDSNGVANVLQFGAIGDGNTHPLSNFYATLVAAQVVYPHAFSLTNEIDWAAIQGAINLQASLSGGLVYVPKGNYQINYPILLPTGPFLRGDGPSSLLTNKMLGGGPVVIVFGSSFPISTIPSWGQVPVQSSLATGAGSAYTLTNSQYINVRDFPQGDIDGLAQICIECFLLVNSPFLRSRFLQSRGARIQTESTTSAFTLSINSSQKLTATLNVAGSVKTVTSASTISLATVHHVALTYDGSTVRLFLDGISQGTPASASGTITQKYSEDFTIGDAVSGWPDGPSEANALSGAVDSVRLSNTARYTSDFTPPTAKFTADANTLFLCNFDSILTVIVGCTTSNGQGYTVYRCGTGNFGQTQMRDLAIDGGRGHAVFGLLSPSSILESIYITACRSGMQFWNNCYTSSILNPFVGLSTRYGLVMSGAMSEMTIQNPNIRCTGGLGIGGTNWDGTVIGGTVFGCPKVSLMAKSVAGPLTLIGGPDVGDENSTVVPDDGLLFSAVSSAVNISGGGGAFINHAIPPVTIDGTGTNIGAFTIAGYYFWLNVPPPASAVKVVNPPRVCSIVGCQQSASPIIAWADNLTNFHTDQT